MSKQTVVEWLLWELSKVGYLPDGLPEAIHNKAKAMEREQIEHAYAEGGNWDELPKTRFDNYYYETYGKEAGHD